MAAQGKVLARWTEERVEQLTATQHQAIRAAALNLANLIGPLKAWEYLFEVADEVSQLPVRR